MHLSPSENHRYLMENLQPSHSWDGSDLKQWQRKLRPKVKNLLGTTPKEKCDLNVRSIWKKKHKYGTIEKIVFTAEAFSDVPAYICLPDAVDEPYTFMICVQGHSGGMYNSIAVDPKNHKKTIAIKGDRDFGIGCMKRCIAALCIEQRSFGERQEKEQKMVANHGCHDATMHALMLGRTLTGERVYDVDRGIDYLASRGDVNMKKIGVMGNSGGGTVSLFSAATNPRIAFAMPSCYFNTFQDSIMSIYHCMDNYIPGILELAEMSDVMGLFAPKPIVIVAGRDDELFPVEATKKAFKELKKIYKAAGAEKIGDGGHRFYADDAWPKMLKEIKKL